MAAITPALLAKFPLFAEVDGTTLAALAIAATSKHLPRKTPLIQQGQRHGCMYVLQSGRMCLTRTSPTGMEVIVRMVGPQESLLEELVFDPHASPFGAVAESECQLVCLPAEVLRQAVAGSPTLSRNLLALLASRSQHLMAGMEGLVARSAEDRLMGYLVEIMLESGGPRTSFELPYSKAAIARHLGMTPETFSRCLPVLAKRGITLQGKTVHLATDHTLCAGCDPLHARKCNACGRAQCTVGDAV